MIRHGEKKKEIKGTTTRTCMGLYGGWRGNIKRSLSRTLSRLSQILDSWRILENGSTLALRCPATSDEIRKFYLKKVAAHSAETKEETHNIDSSFSAPSNKKTQRTPNKT
ncbi:10700_t:CDS:1 [Ambispora gerdemannii]|uniref:10700_t:CDS:1 n=1 Tax=Ambispora gerdemannii TaxID=144530 RepID=A0A9N9GWI0_9GLOM|nr:10700_t:CDS:1 [Ambispora gerdemannii]